MKRDIQGLPTLTDIRAFVAGSQAVGFEIDGRDAADYFVSATHCAGLAIVVVLGPSRAYCAYLMADTGLLRAQITRLIGQHRKTGRVRDRREAPAKSFTRRHALR